MKCHKENLSAMAPPRRRLLPFFLLCSLAIGSEACQNSKKKAPPKKPISDQSSVEPGGGSGTGGDGQQRPASAGAPAARSDDVSTKLTADERSLLGNFACEYKSKSDKVLKLAKMINDSDNRKVVDDLGKNYDADKVKALINLAKKIDGSKKKTEATLKSLCSSKSEDKKSNDAASEEENETEDGSDNKI
jgi:hypothetical protein